MFTGHATRTEKKCFELGKIKKQSQVVFIGTDKQIYQPDQERKPTTLKTERMAPFWDAEQISHVTLNSKESF